MDAPKPTYYNLQELDLWLRYSDPARVADELNEIMLDLMGCCKRKDSYYPYLEHSYYILRQLRDAFRNLEKQS